MPITHKIAAVGGGDAVPTAGENCRRTAAGRAAVWRRRKRRAHGGGKIAAVGGGESRRLAAETKGDRTPYGFLSPLDSPHLPLR